MEILRTNQLESQKAKRHQVHEQPHRVHGYEHHGGDGNNDGTGGLKKDCMQLSEVVALEDIYFKIINSLTNYIRIKVR